MDGILHFLQLMIPLVHMKVYFSIIVDEIDDMDA